MIEQEGLVGENAEQMEHEARNCGGTTDVSSIWCGRMMPLVRCIHLPCSGDKVPGQQTDLWETLVPPGEEGRKVKRPVFNIHQPEFKS